MGVFAQKGVCNFAQNRYSGYCSYLLSALFSLTVFLPLCDSTSLWPAAISSGFYHELIPIQASTFEATSTYYFLYKERRCIQINMYFVDEHALNLI